MALITTRNIVMPFTNKLHLTTMILIVMAFTILRLAGCEIDVIKQSSTTPTFNNEQSTSATESRSTDQQAPNSLDDIERMFE